MLCCTGQCRDRSCSPAASPNNNNNNNNANPYLKFEDYFGPEMKRAYSEDSTVSPSAPATKVKCDISVKLPNPPELISNVHSTLNCKIFLGGSCNPTTWRHDIAIPTLKKLGLTYYNPQVSSWSPDLMEVEHHAKTNAEILFYVMNNQTRGTAAAVEVAHAVAKQRKIILVISGFKPGQKICDETISQKEYEDLTSAQQILQDIVERHGIPVFNDIQTALQCTAKVIQERIRPQDLKLSDLAQLYKFEHLPSSNLKLWICKNLKKTFDTLDVQKRGEISITDFPPAFEILMNRTLKREDVENALGKIEDPELSSAPTRIAEPTNGVHNGSSSSSNSSNCNSSNAKKENGVNGVSNGATVLSFEQFCCIMAEIIYHNHGKSNFSTNGSSSPNQLETKASGVLRNLFATLTKVLDNFPGSKPAWNHISSETETSITPSYDVYLGGSSKATSEESWRSKLALPLLKKHELTYLIPEAFNGSKRLLPSFLSEIEKSRLIFFYIPDNSRSLDLCMMAVYYIGLGCQVVLCIEELKNDCQIDGEKLSTIATKDYMRCRSYLSDMATRDGVQVFQDLPKALDFVVEKCQSLKDSKNL